jgi:hypothetical protein
MLPSDLKRLKKLEEENSKLKKLVPNRTARLRQPMNAGL